MNAKQQNQEFWDNQNPLFYMKQDELRRIAKYTPIITWMSQPDKPANWFNPEWYEFSGRTEKSMQNWAYQDFHHPAHLHRVLQKRDAAFRAGKIWEDTFPLLGKDKKYHRFFVRGIPIFDEDGQLLYYYGWSLDISRNLKISI